MTTVNLNRIEVGDQVFGNEGGEEFGAVRQVLPGGRQEIVVYIENAGDFTVPLSAVHAAHDQKVVLNVKALDDGLRGAIKHAHDRETEPQP